MPRHGRVSIEVIARPLHPPRPRLHTHDWPDAAQLDSQQVIEIETIDNLEDEARQVITRRPLVR
jgi:hypothetical protein